LCRLRATFANGQRPASRHVRRLGRLVGRLPVAPLVFFVLGTSHLALALDAWRRARGPVVAQWLAAVGEWEALCALAAYAYENPEDPFPEVVEAGPLRDAEGLGHPFLPVDRCVRNDLCLDGQRRVLLVSGSNMAGKSTLLRTVGVNAVLALAGAPVRARRLRLSRLA